MNEIATSYNQSLCNRIDIETSVLEELKDEIASAAHAQQE